MAQFMSNLVTAGIHGSVVILAVILLRLVLRKTPKKYICLLWLLAGIRLLMPIEIRSDLSLQPEFALPVDLNLPAILLWVWGVVAICFGIYSLTSYVKLKNKVREAIRIRGGWESDRIDTAFILGFIKPRIYIPMGMNHQARKHILEHERTHLDKGDHWIKMIGFLALALHWFNPLVWVAYILLCKDIEMACDERVVQFMELDERKSYSAALIACSSKQLHFSANPVAFGEVSVKQRILSVLNYKKPSFWISLLGVVAFFFVAVCLVTSPMGEAAPAMENLEATELTEPTEPAETLPMDQQIYNQITGSFEELLSGDYYNLFFYEVDDNGGVGWQAHYLKDGENTMWWSTNHVNRDGYMHYEGKDYVISEEDMWVPGEPMESELDALLHLFSLEDKELFSMSYSNVTADNGNEFQRIKFVSQWAPEPEMLKTQPMEFTYTMDGKLSTGRVERVYWRTYDHMGFSNDTVERKYVTAAFEEAFAQVASEELQAQVGVRPSNYTDYDKDFALGSAQMAWYFMDGDWFFKFGAEDATATSAKLVVEVSQPWGDYSVGEGKVTAPAEYYIETLKDGKWVDVPRITEEFVPVQPKVLGNGDTLSINWEKNYGTLPAGYYRIGMYYEFEGSGGAQDTTLGYAKFRVYNPNQDALLNDCRDAISAVLNADHYHLYSFNWMTEFNYDYYLSSEIWKNGKDYLSVTRYPSRKDLSVMTNVRGELWRDGKNYGLSWEGEAAESPVSAWNGSVDGYMDDSNLSMWSWEFEWYDSQVEEVSEDGSNIRIISTYDYSDQYEVSEITLTFDEKGNLKGMVKAYLPKRNCTQEEKIIDKELVIFDTPKAEIASLIAAQDIDTPMPFSYEEDVQKNPHAIKTGFRNTSPKTVKTIADALALADKESTMEPLMEFQTGYCQYRVYHDDAAGMWKVDMFWWQHDTMQTVYMTDEGITKMLVSVK